MSTYLATATNGNYTITTGRSPGGVPYFNAVAPQLVAASAPVLAKLPAMIDYFATVYGRYPQRSAGAIVADLPDLGYALETQTRPVFSTPPDEATLSNEIAHRCGNATTAQFTAFASAVSGRNLRHFFDVWLYQPGKPTG